MLAKALVLFCLGTSSLSAIGSGCAFSPVQVDPVEPGRNDIYAGKKEKTELRFINEDPGNSNVQVFPEAPLTVNHLSTGTRCEIKGKGYIWPRQHIYLNGRESVLLVDEYSGAADSLVLYQTRTCKKLKEFDVSGAYWKVNEHSVSVGYDCTDRGMASCRKKKEIDLNRFCKNR